MRPVTNNQVKRFNVLLNKLQLQDEQKRDLIYQYTNGRTEHTKEMAFEEISALNGKLQADLNTRRDADEEKVQRMRRRIISLCHEMGMRYAGTTRINMDRVNKLIEEKGYLKDHGKLTINDYGVNELPKLVTQIERIRDHHISKRYKSES